MRKFLLPAILGLVTLPASFMGGWFAAAGMAPAETPPPAGPEFVDIGYIYLNPSPEREVLPLRVGLTVTAKAAQEMSLARMRDEGLTLLALATEMPVVMNGGADAPERISEAISHFAPDWLLHMKVIATDTEYEPVAELEPETEPDGASPANQLRAPKATPSETPETAPKEGEASAPEAKSGR